MNGDVTVHITIPRREWDLPEFGFGEDIQEARDRLLGQAIRAEALHGLRRIKDRLKPDATVQIKRIEVTLVDTASATLDEDPDAHIP